MKYKKVVRLYSNSRVSKYNKAVMLYFANMKIAQAFLIILRIWKQTIWFTHIERKSDIAAF